MVEFLSFAALIFVGLIALVFFAPLLGMFLDSVAEAGEAFRQRIVKAVLIRRMRRP